ncbi:energy transducer TonB [Brevundimonas sp.]|jgi:TonB family protein|uniref:energy transducer TonB n=1 Tax=Brevundimonas sp. TaxID=1871086 RepID=UPI002E15B09E|nr:energy transducer TonB [Brevundimonas sp.]
MKSQSLVLTAALAFMPAAAWAQSEDARPPVIVATPSSQPLPARPSMITNPAWARQPQLAYPQAALDAGLEGAVTLSCTVSRDGRLTDCEVREDVTPGYGFAEAALAGAETARVSPRTVDGLAQDGKATWTARFRLPDPAEAPSPPPADGGLYAADGRLMGDSPRWTRRPTPTAGDLPPALLRTRGPVHAGAVVACRVREDGRLEDCRAEDETPRGAGVGAAAVRIARRGRLETPVAADPSGARPIVRTTITFHVGI